MRKVFIRLFLSALILTSLLAVTAYAEDATVIGNDVNFRTGPGMNYEVTDCLEKGTVVTVNDRSDSNWYSITYNGKTGFVSSMYLSVSQTAPAEAPAETQQSTSGSFCINAMYVRFRGGPSTDYSILGEYNTGTAVTVLGTSGEWTRVSIYGQEGYVFSSYISEAQAAEVQAAQPAVAEAQQEQTTVQPEAAAAQQVQVEETKSYEGYINADYVRFRQGPGTGYSIISSYNRNQSVTVTGTSGDWARVLIAGQEGYVYSQYVSTKQYEQAQSQPEQASSAGSVTSAGVGYIKGTNVRFREGASLSSRIIAEYSTGAQLSILETGSEWVKATINGETGYVYKSYITSTAPAVSTEGSTLGQQLANYAMQFLGYDYVWGGESPDEGFDCSGLVWYVYYHFGYSIERVACNQANCGTHVEPDQLQPGDILCFYSGDGYIGHSGLYIGNGQFIHASTYSTGVIVTELAGSYYENNFEARRIVQ